MGVAPKRKEQGEDICKETPVIEFEQDWSFTLGAALGDREKIKKILFLLQEFFPRKADSAIWLVFKCTINPQNLMKIVVAIFEKIKILIFYVNYP